MQNREPEFFEDDELSLVPEGTEEVEIEEEKEEKEENPNPVEEEEEEEIDKTVVAKEEEEEVDETNIYKINYDILTEAGALKLPEDFKFEPTEEGFIKAVEASKESIRTSILDELSSSLPAKGVELLNYMLETGSDNIEAFIESQKEPDFEAIEVTEEDEELQENLVRAYLQNTTKYSEERIEKEIARYKLDKELYNQATEAKTELALMQKQYREELKQKEATAAAEAKENAKKATQLFKSTIETNTVINGVVFTKDDAVNLTDAVFRPIKDKQGNVTTRFNQKLDEVLRDPKKTAVLAKLLEKDLNIESFQKPLEKKAAVSVKTKLEKATIPTLKGKTVTTASGFDWDSVLNK